MLDFAIRLNNTLYLTGLEKSDLWFKLSAIAQDRASYKKPKHSFERLLLYFLKDWASLYKYDHFGRESIFTKLISKVVSKLPENLKNEFQEGCNLVFTLQQGIQRLPEFLKAQLKTSDKST